MTPFEKVLGILKQTEMLLERTTHDYKYGFVSVYTGNYVAITEEAARVIEGFFREIDLLTIYTRGVYLRVECRLHNEDEKIKISTISKYQIEGWKKYDTF